jgi:8-oxo-dGTP pyrophosphatase MutT (NUDIX family)
MPWTSDFSVKHGHPRSVTVLDHSQGKDTARNVNAAFEKIVQTCLQKDLFHVLDRKHSEPFSIIGANFPVSIERFASPLFGITSRGAHLIAYTQTADGMKIWIPRRSEHLYTSPGKLDSTVAGGVKDGVTPFETIIQEGNEEASLSEPFMRQNVRSRGVITYISTTGPDFPGEKGLFIPDIIYVYDLQLSDEVVPKPHDDEVKDFRCLTVKEAQHALLTQEFKPDSAAVLIDFMIRHGIITAENEKDFVEINMHLHRRLPSRTRPNGP